MDQLRLQTAILRMLHEGRIDNRFTGVYFMQAVRDGFQGATPHDIMEATWALVARRLAYIDGTQPASENWKLFLTAAGKLAAGGDEANPEVPHEYLRGIRSSVPSVDSIVLEYLADSVETYSKGSYRPSVLMLGVASEVTHAASRRHEG